MDPQSIPAFTNGRDIVQAKLQHRRTNVEAGRGNYDASGGRLSLVAVVSIRRDVLSLHVPDEVVLAHDEIRGMGVRREGYHLRAPHPNVIIQGARTMKQK